MFCLRKSLFVFAAHENHFCKFNEKMFCIVKKIFLFMLIIKSLKTFLCFSYAN